MDALIVCIVLLQSTVSPKVPSLKNKSAVGIQNSWKAIKAERNVFKQRDLLNSSNLHRAYCPDVLDAAKWVRRAGSLLQLRDTTRYRTAIRPELLATMEIARRLFEKESPGKRLVLGDVAQPGCGQIAFGTVVRFVAPTELEILKKQFSYRFGFWSKMRAVSPNDYVDEYPRFENLYGPLWVEEAITGVTKSGKGRIERRRFIGGTALKDYARARLIRRIRQRLSDKKLVERDWVYHGNASGKLRRHRRAVWVDPERSLWMEVVWKYRRGRRTNSRSLERVRFSRYDRKKPGSRRDEYRYIFGDDGEAGVVVQEYSIVYEAHHTSHLAGFDADISYVTTSNQGHFDTEEPLDATASWHWLNALYSGAQKAGVPLRAMFVDPKIIALLRTVDGADRKLPIWRKLRPSPGHDSHVHIRVGPTRVYSKLNYDSLMQRIDAIVQAAD